MLSTRIARLGAVCALALGTLFASQSAQATPAFAMKEKQKCNYCHVKPGEARNFRGLYYAANEHSFEKFDNEFEAKAAGVPVDALGPEALPKTKGYPGDYKVAKALNFVMQSIDDKPVNLGRYQGKVVLVVNVASKCGLTPQYKPLQALYEKYKEKGLVILGFPANEFGAQEPGSNEEIKKFCTDNYKVTFPMFSKIVVKGEEIHPFYKFLTSKETNEKFAGEIEWNFAKFVLNRKGEVVGRIKANTKPDSADVVKMIEKELTASAKE
jgi:glutathione peroxidase